MYLCNCNGLTVTDVIKACSSGVTKPGEVFAFYKVEKQCGKCVPEIEEYFLNSKKM